MVYVCSFFDPGHNILPETGIVKAKTAETDPPRTGFSEKDGIPGCNNRVLRYITV